MSEAKDSKGRTPTQTNPTPVQVLERAQRALETVKGAIASTAEYKKIFEAHQELYKILSGGKPVVAGKTGQREPPDVVPPQKPPEANA